MDNLGTGTVTVDGEPVTKIYYGANGNASGLAVLLELARMLQTNRLMLRRSVLIVGFGASRQAFAGSWYFLNRSFSDVSNIDAMIDLDMLGTGTGGFFAYTASNADMNAFTERLAADLQPIKPETVTKEPYPSDYIAFYDKKIPSVFFSTGQYPEHDTERDTQSILDFDTMEKELEYIYNYSVVLAGGEKPVFDPSDLSSLTRGGKGAVPYYDC
jgi:Zn-dependent M28 family amino/carboxypeptidase